MKKAKLLLRLFFTMLKIGLFTFGGGYVMIALLENEFVTKKCWIGKDEFLDMVAIAESTPGPIAVNAATYIGYQLAGVAGSAVATLAVCIPSFAIILLISLFYDAFMQIKVVKYAFFGIRIAVVYLILSAGVRLLCGMKKNLLSRVLCGATILLMVLFSLFSVKFSTVFYILIGGAVGLAVYGISRIRAKRGGSV